jgi:hypothetical protein
LKDPLDGSIRYILNGRLDLKPVKQVRDTDQSFGNELYLYSLDWSPDSLSKFKTGAIQFEDRKPLGE